MFDEHAGSKCVELLLFKIVRFLYFCQCSKILVNLYLQSLLLVETQNFVSELTSYKPDS